MRYLTKYIYIFLFLNTTIVCAQKITLRDAVTKAPISDVLIYNSKGVNTVSDFNGKATLHLFKNDDFLLFSHISYQDTTCLKSLVSATIYLKNKADELSEVSLSISKSKVKKSRIAEKIETLNKADIQKLTPQTTADILAQTPSIRVQKSQGGGGSPVIRGFEANRVLLVMDNVRMNNAIYRTGHLQNAITVSPYNLERTEVIFGPSSVIYGSDALGGVIHFYTKTPKLNQLKQFRGSSTTQFSSANNAFTQGFSSEFSFKKWASYTAFSQANFGDTRMGENRVHGYQNWGLVPTYSNNSSTYYNESPVNNTDPSIQKNTGYNQFDFLQKIAIQTGKKSSLIFNFQFSESTNIPRFDKLTELKDGVLKFAEWNYGPQKRTFLSSQYKFEHNSKWLDTGTITAAYQYVKESRIKRKFNDLERKHQNEAIGVFSLNTDFNVTLSKNRTLSYGAELTHNALQSSAYGSLLAVQNNTVIGVTDNTSIQSRYPDGGSTYSTAAAYLNYRQDIARKATLNTGGRFTYTNLQANFIDQTYISLPQQNISLDNSSFTANIGLTYRPSKKIHLNTVLASGFRSPNIDDVGKIREKNNLLTVPNIHLKPEYAYNAEIGITHYFTKKEHVININGFYTLLKNYIARGPYTLDNDTSTIDSSTVLYDGEEVTTIANINGNTAAIYGGTIDLKIRPIKQLTFKGNLTYTKGKTNTPNTYLPSISPLFASAKITYSKKAFSAGVQWRYSASKKADEYSSGGEDNLEETPLIDPNTDLEGDEYYAGSPSWSTLNSNISYQISRDLKIHLNLDNMFDVHYKAFASGISAPGRNISTVLHFTF